MDNILEGIKLEETIIINVNSSGRVKLGNIIISVAQSVLSDNVKCVVGRQGFPNISAKLSAGGALLFETPEGLFEIRVMTIETFSAQFLVSHISPNPGIAGGIIDKDPSNAQFSKEELIRIASSINSIKIEIEKQSGVKPEQLEYIDRKLDEMLDASTRLGRKDWINLSVGLLTNTIVTLALNPTVAKNLFQIVSVALSWIFGGSLKILSQMP